VCNYYNRTDYILRSDSRITHLLGMNCGWNLVSGSQVTGSRVSVSDPVFDQVLSFNIHDGIVSTE